MAKSYPTGQLCEPVRSIRSTPLGADIPFSVLEQYRKRLINRTWQLIPLREEGGDWQKQINTLLVDFHGIYSLMDIDIYFISACVKLSGLTHAVDFPTYRRSVFDIIDLIGRMYDDG